MQHLPTYGEIVRIANRIADKYGLGVEEVDHELLRTETRSRRDALDPADAVPMAAVFVVPEMASLAASN